MRVSMKEGDEGFLGFRPPGGIKVFFDGIEISRVLMADEERRQVRVARLNDRGHVFTYAGEIVTETRYGHVRIEMTDEARALVERAQANQPGQRTAHPLNGPST